MLRHKLLNITKQTNYLSMKKVIKYTSAGM